MKSSNAGGHRRRISATAIGSEYYYSIRRSRGITVPHRRDWDRYTPKQLATVNAEPSASGVLRKPVSIATWPFRTPKLAQPASAPGHALRGLPDSICAARPPPPLREHVRPSVRPHTRAPHGPQVQKNKKVRPHSGTFYHLPLRPNIQRHRGRLARGVGNPGNRPAKANPGTD